MPCQDWKVVDLSEGLMNVLHTLSAIGLSAYVEAAFERAHGEAP